METTEARVIRAIQPFAQAPVTLDTTLESLVLDSLEIMSMMFAVEEEFDITIQANLADMKTVRDIVKVAGLLI